MQFSHHFLRGVLLGGVFAVSAAATPAFYDHGQPTAYEQYLLELINRARADPAAEALWHGIDLNEGLTPGTLDDAPKQPLAMHRFLMDAARDHSQWMLDTDTVSHTGAGGSTESDRIVAAGYVLQPPWATGENISWGGTTVAIDPLAYTLAAHTNLFRSAGHRVNMMEDDFEEVGMGAKGGVLAGWNAWLVTQKFASSGASPSPFLVGAAYYDFSGNELYDVGEAIGGVTVTVAEGAYYTETAEVGGYSLPVPAASAWRDVTFSGPGFTVTTNVFFPGNRNVKVDFVPTYTPPSLSGSPTPVVGDSNSYAISEVWGATAYEVAVRSRWPVVMDSPVDLSRMLDGTAAEYDAFQTAVRYSEPGAYHLAHTANTFAYEPEWIEYDDRFAVQAGGELRFRSRVRGATENQIAQVQVSADDGESWDAVYTQAGPGWPGETSFSLRTVLLADYEGQMIRVRFSYVAVGGYYAGTSAEYGWFIDDVEFENVEWLDEVDVAIVLPGESFVFTPAEEAEYWLQARPLNFDLAWPAGPERMVTAVDGPVLAFGNWAAAWETTHDLAAGALADLAGDYSGDGVRHLLAYVLDLDPIASHGPTDLPRFLPGQPIFHYWRHAQITDAELVPQVSIDLVHWHDWDSGASPVTANDTLSHHEGAVEHRHLTFVPGTHTTVFVRLRARLF